MSQSSIKGMFMNKKCIVFCTYAITPRLMCYVSLKPLVRINEGNMVKLNKAKKKKKKQWITDGVLETCGIFVEEREQLFGLPLHD